MTFPIWGIEIDACRSFAHANEVQQNMIKLIAVSFI
jgi:hypothetical protein